MNTKLVATACFLGTLSIGVAAGIYVDRTLLRPRSAFPGYDAHGGPMLRNFSRQLDLTSQQHGKLTRILENYRQRFGTIRRTMNPRYMAVRDSLHAEIYAILTPQQQEKFNSMIHRFGGRHRKMLGQPPSKGPPESDP